MSVDPTALPKLIVMRGKPEDRTFAQTFALMRARRAAMPQDVLAGFRPRRTSAGAIAAFNLPPLPEPEILKPLSVVSISSDDLDEDESPAALLPEVGFVSVLVAGEDDLEIEPDESESGDESLDIGQDAYQAEG